MHARYGSICGAAAKKSAGESSGRPTWEPSENQIDEVFSFSFRELPEDAQEGEQVRWHSLLLAVLVLADTGSWLQ